MSNPQDTGKFDPEEWRKTLIQMREKCETESLDAVVELEKLLESVDAVSLFIAVIANTCFSPAELFSEATHGDLPAKVETLAYYAYPFFEKSNNREITPWHINKCIEIMDKMLALRLMVHWFPKDDREPDPLEDIVTTVRMQAEVVRGSAFPEQTASEVISIQGHFDNWFANRVGIKPTRAQAMLWSIIRTQENAINSVMLDIRKQVRAAGKKWQKIKKKLPKSRSPTEVKILEVLQDEQAAKAFELVSRLNTIAPEILPTGLKDLVDLEPIPTAEEWEGLIGLIGMTKNRREEMSEIVEVRRRPLFVLPDNRVILVDISNALDALWESFEQVAKKDQGFFSGQYQRERAKWLQQKTVDCLSRIFPSQYIYQNLTYPDPSKSDGSTAELDIAVHWGPFLILLEAKANQFRLESQLGDIGRLRSDIKANVEDAFDQAKRAARYIDQTNKPEFVEPSTGRRLIIPKDKIHRMYLITVSQQLLAGLATRLSMFKDLGLFSSEEYPLSISIADLETVTHFCDVPDVFLHYIEKRLATQRESLGIRADELDFFGAYLQTRLQPARLWDREDVKPTDVALLGFSAQFDDWFAYNRGDLSTPPSIELEIPIEIKQILEELRKRDDYASRWISFALLDMSDSMLGQVVKSLADLRTATLTPGMFRRWTYAERETVVSLIGSLDLSPRLLEQRAQIRAVIEKYRHKAVKSIGLGVMVKDKSKIFHCAAWVEGPWEYDAEMEKIMQDEPPFMPTPGTKLPGRNAPCLCGSGKKFKKCCLPKIQAAQKHLG
jgi:hypothetical protein